MGFRVWRLVFRILGLELRAWRLLLRGVGVLGVRGAVPLEIPAIHRVSGTLIPKP